jgi:hypothetical protein
VFFLAPFAPPPVSYGLQVAPILALHCNVCHGDAGGLSTRSYAELMRGGNMGPVIVAGAPDRSLLIHFVDGRRGEAHRMPLNGRPLTSEQIDVLRRWIAEGAIGDASAPPTYIERRDVRASKVLRISCRLDTPGYLTVTVRDRATGRGLFTDVATVKSPKDPSDAGMPGDLISWQVTPGHDWPETVTVELTVEYAPRKPNIELQVSP